ncbi:MAG: DUF6515 family protein [Pirellulales bacterium]
MIAHVRIAVLALLVLAFAGLPWDAVFAGGKGHGHRGGHGGGRHHHHHHHRPKSGIGISFGTPSISLNFGSPRPVYVPPPVVYHPAPYRYYYPSYYPGVRYVVAPPAGYVVTTLGGVQHYYHEGTYYRPLAHEGRTVYQVVDVPATVAAPQIASAQPSAPQAASREAASPEAASPETVVVNGATYYRDRATFLQKSNAPGAIAASATASGRSSEPAELPRPADPNEQYQVVAAPIGATLDALPRGAQAIDVDGTRYYHSGETFYLPIRVAGAEKYVVVSLQHK